MGLLARVGLLGRAVPPAQLARQTGRPGAGAWVGAVAAEVAARWAALLGSAGVGAKDLAGLRLPGDVVRDVVWFRFGRGMDHRP
ncbi:MAG: hypothetical protein R2695_06550 [Acidimicrobiales bacterium]